MAAAAYGDIENQFKAGPTGLRGISPEEVRVGFIRKVYGTVALQVGYTAAFAALCVNGPLRDPLIGFVANRPSLFSWGTFIASMAALIVCQACKKVYPVNMYALFFFTTAISLNVGVMCAVVSASGLGELIIQAAVITALLTAGLTLYAFKSKRDFSFLGAILWPLLFALTLYNLFSIFFPSLRMGAMGWAYSLVGALIWCGYIVFDTWRILKVYQPDSYIEAAIQLYLDIINLFLQILEILMKLNKDRR